ncbi:stalk domain-containing protein [Paenibacillus spongiae]|uniref:Copper amine oxidase-like N-terminal domain-containing protein n=1 Tax=Paenibacillus spongiae TaxID=2909671 RepID=A0ABY5S3L9_9BACL|nr:stalk domain-containing protein [Paenibacillus spongiae]UVI28494.1 hypothetical protein L1F29_24010 [Paenibacillus spongiae]
MRRRIAVVMILLVACMSGASSLSAAGVKIVIDGRELLLPAPPIQINGVTMVPFRSLFESLGLNVVWEAKAKRITGKSADVTVAVKLGSLEAQVNGKAAKLLAAPITQGSLTYIPLRFVSEALSRDVRWDPLTGVIMIGAKKAAAAPVSNSTNQHPAAGEGKQTDHVTGKVLDPGGSPVAGAMVIVSYADLELEGAFEGKTDSDGRYAVSGFESGEDLIVRAEPPQGNTVYSDSSLISITYADMTRDVELMLRKVDVEGSVTDEAGRPVPDQPLYVFEGEEKTPNLMYRTDANGKFHIGGLLKGKTYRLSLIDEEFRYNLKPSYTFTYQEVDPQPQLVMKRTYAIVLAVDQDGKPISSDPYSIRIRDQQRRELESAAYSVKHQAPIIEGFKAGERYEAQLYFVESNAKYEQAAPYSFTFDPSSKEPIRVPVTLRDPVQFTDSIVDEDGKPVANARVRFYDQVSQEEKLFYSDSSGKVDIRGLTAGKEYFQVVDPASWLSHEDQPYVSGNSAKFIYTEEVTRLPARTLYHIQLKVMTVKQNGEPVTNTTVFIEDSHGNLSFAAHVGGGYHPVGRLTEGQTYTLTAVYRINAADANPKPDLTLINQQPDPVTFVYKPGMEPIVLKFKV